MADIDQLSGNQAVNDCLDSIIADLGELADDVNTLTASGLPVAAYLDPIYADLMFDGATPPDAAESITVDNRTKRVRQFSGSATQDVFFSMTVPPGYGTVKFRVAGLFTNATGPSDEGMAYRLSGFCVADGGAFSAAFGTAVTVIKTGLTEDQYDTFLTDWSGALTLPGIAGYKEACFKFERVHDHASDTYGQKAGVEKIIINWNAI